MRGILRLCGTERVNRMARIMIVDDEPDLVATLRDLVRKAGHEIFTAGNGQEFLDSVEKSRPDLVLLDIMMPGLSTRQILDKLKEKKLRGLKVILLTVVRMGEDESKELLKNPPIVDYITKPFDITALMKRIKKQL